MATAFVQPEVPQIALPMAHRAWIKWALVLALWTLVGLFFTSQHYLTVALLFDRQATWWRSLLSTLPDWWLWAALTPLIVALAEWFPLERGALGPRLLLHGSAAAVIAVLHLVLSVGIFTWLEPIPCMVTTFGEQFPINFAYSVHWNVLIYALIVAVTDAGRYYRHSQEQARRAGQLDARLSQARWQALQAQLHPHFLFNTLNTVAELIHDRPAAAEAMLVGLGDLLRQTLDDAGRQMTTLRDELDYARKYLEIEQIRFEDRLTVRWRIEPETLAAPAPRLLLQPLVENAVKHGVSRVSRPGWIEITARRSDARLVVEVRDNGAGLSSAASPARPSGLGLENTRARLEQLYGAEQRLELTANPSGGAVATVELPWEMETVAGVHGKTREDEFIAGAPPAAEGDDSRPSFQTANDIPPMTARALQGACR